MKLVYASRTGNVEKLVSRLGTDNVLKITTGDETVAEPVFLIGLLCMVTGYIVDGSFNPFLYFRF